jgi:hypothetical protein
VRTRTEAAESVNLVTYIKNSITYSCFMSFSFAGRRGGWCKHRMKAIIAVHYVKIITSMFSPMLEMLLVITPTRHKK